MAEQNKLAFWYTAPVVASIAALGNASVAINFDQDSKFVWTNTTYFVDLSAAAFTDTSRPVPLITVTMLDTGSGRNLLYSAAPIDSIAGNKGAEKYTLPLAREFAPSATLRLTYANYSAATTYTNLYLVLHGYKVFN